MDNPGMSVFAGAPSLHMDHSAQERLDEEEELEDQRRRNQEIKLAKGFDDLIDDDDASSVNSSINCTSMGISKSGNLPDNDTNGVDHARTRNPPTYVESLNHMKDAQYTECQSKPHENHNRYPLYGDEGANVRHSPLGAGDAHEVFYYQHDFRGHPGLHHNGVNSYEVKQDILNNEQLKVMYEMRVKECQQLAAQLQSVQASADTEADSLRARLSVATSDRDKAELSLQQAQHLLASSKHRIVELEQELNRMNERLSAAGEEKENLTLELRAATLGLQDSQQRLQSAQMTRNHDTDVLFREQQDRHREETERLREDLEKARNRIAEKENEVKILEKRCLETERSKEEVLLEKTSTINRLCLELDAAQTRLLSSDMSQRLQQLQHERNTASHQLKTLGAKLEQTAQELVLERKELSRVREEFDSWRESLGQMVHDAAPDRLFPGSSPTSASKSLLSALTDILYRYKQQGHQLNKLTDEITKKDKKLEVCRKLESDLHSRLEEQKGIEVQLTSKLAVLQKKMELLGGGGDEEHLDRCKEHNRQLEERVEELRKELKQTELKYAELELEHDKLKADKINNKSLERETNADLLRELEKFSEQLKASLKENGELKRLYLQICNARDTLSRELIDVRAKLASLQKDKDDACERERLTSEALEQQRRQAELLTRELAKGKVELEVANKRISEQQKEFTEKQREFTDKLDKYIKEETSIVCKEQGACPQCAMHLKTIGSLEQEVQHNNHKLETTNVLIRDLRSKAEHFEQYILQRYQKLRDVRHVATSTERSGPEVEPALEPAVEAEDKLDGNDTRDTLASRTDMMLKEKRIREQIAEQFSLEIKTIEMNCSNKISQLEKDNAAMVSKLKHLLETKAQEVEVLKKFILSERSKIAEILEAKEKEVTIITQENRSLQEEYRNFREKATELKHLLEKSHNKNAKLKHDLEKRSAELVMEREKKEKALEELSEQLKGLDVKTSQVESQHNQLKDKYRNVKKTALVYKEYANKKDEHVEGELKRIRGHYEGELESIRAHYEGVVEKLHEKLQKVVKKRREIEVNDKINKMQSDFDAMLSEVNNAT